MINVLVVWLSLVIPSKELVLRDQVDVIELNHKVNGLAEVEFDQVIFWKWYSVDCRYHVVTWKMGLEARPFRRYDRGGWWFSSWSG